MRLLALATILLSLPLFQACEQQKWEETKMFHDVPKKGGAAHAEHAEKPATPAENK